MDCGEDGLQHDVPKTLGRLIAYIFGGTKERKRSVML